MDDGDAGEWAPIKQVAADLGISIDTVRRRIQRGDLAARREDTPQGYRWLVRLDAPPNPPELPRTRAASSHESGVMLVDDRRDELIATLRDELASRVREVAELHEVILAQAKALELRAAIAPTPSQARQEGLAATIAEQPSNESNEASSRERRSGIVGWWDRVMGR